MWTLGCEQCPSCCHLLTSRTFFLLDLSLLAQVRVAPRSFTVCSGVVRVLGCLCGDKGMRVAPAQRRQGHRDAAGGCGLPSSRKAVLPDVLCGTPVSPPTVSAGLGHGWGEGHAHQLGDRQVLGLSSPQGTFPALPRDPGEAPALESLSVTLQEGRRWQSPRRRILQGESIRPTASPHALGFGVLRPRSPCPKRLCTPRQSPEPPR